MMQSSNRDLGEFNLLRPNTINLVTVRGSEVNPLTPMVLIDFVYGILVIIVIWCGVYM